MIYKRCFIHTCIRTSNLYNLYNNTLITRILCWDIAKIIDTLPLYCYCLILLESYFCWIIRTGPCACDSKPDWRAYYRNEIRLARFNMNPISVRPGLTELVQFGSARHEPHLLGPIYIYHVHHCDRTDNICSARHENPIWSVRETS